MPHRTFFTFRYGREALPLLRSTNRWLSSPWKPRCRSSTDRYCRNTPARGTVRIRHKLHHLGRLSTYRLILFAIQRKFNLSGIYDMVPPAVVQPHLLSVSSLRSLLGFRFLAPFARSQCKPRLIVLPSITDSMKQCFPLSELSIHRGTRCGCQHVIDGHHAEASSTLRQYHRFIGFV